jgi:hypothetical protein
MSAYIAMPKEDLDCESKKFEDLNGKVEKALEGAEVSYLPHVGIWAIESKGLDVPSLLKDLPVIVEKEQELRSQITQSGS